MISFTENTKYTMNKEAFYYGEKSPHNIFQDKDE